MLLIWERYRVQILKIGSGDAYQIVNGTPASAVQSVQAKKLFYFTGSRPNLCGGKRYNPWNRVGNNGPYHFHSNDAVGSDSGGCLGGASRATYYLNGIKESAAAGLFPDSDGKQPSDVQHHCDMPLTMKLRFLSVLLLLACCALAGCHIAQPPVTRAALVGTYTYVSKDPESRATDHSLNNLVLQSDGGYDLIEGGTTKAVSDKKGIWRIVPGNPPNVLLDQAGYPIEIKKNEVRLLVDLDVGIWWVKAK